MQSLIWEIQSLPAASPPSFPEGVMVGTVDDMSDSNDGLSYLLKIKLATDFGKLSDVRVIARTGQEEQKKLENKVTQE